jgi:hypothetical protein
MKPISINHSIITAIARITKDLSVRNSFYQREFLSLDVHRETKLRGYFFAVAICHQTHHLKSKLRGVYGWDYLEDGFVRLMREAPEKLHPEWIQKQSIIEISDLLAGLFSDSGLPEHTTLDRLEERAFLMKNAATYIQEEFAGRFELLLDYSEAKLLNKGKGVYEVFPDMEAFRDPLQKKTLFLLKLLQDANLFSVTDKENLMPVMDYHMMRILLRAGAVEVNDHSLKEKLRNQSPLEEDPGIRAACIRAMKVIAEESGHDILKMNDFYWTLGRSCCTETTRCRDRMCAKNPCTFQEVVAVEDHSKCALEEVCMGAKDDAFRSLWHPVIKTHFY